MTLRFYDGGSFKILAAKPLVHWFFLLACLVLRALLLLPFAVDMDSYLVLAATDWTSTSMTMTTWAPTTGPTQCIREERDLCSTLITRNIVENLCNETRRTRHNFSDSMKFCNWRTYASLRPHGGCLNGSYEECSQCLQELLEREDEIRDMYEDYVSILQRFDCDRSYSMWNCTDCKETYKDWLCATQLPYYRGGRLVKPCLNHCRWARKKCPYLLPHRQYCGQQTFLCPEVRDLQPKNATYAKPPSECLDCAHGDESGPCVSEKFIPERSRGASIHSIPLFAVSLLGCLVSLITARTLCGRCLT